MGTTMQKVFSADGKLYSTMTIDSIKNMGAKDSKELNKKIVLFQQANTDNDDILSLAEIQEYDKNCKNAFWKKVAIFAGTAILGGIAGYGIFKYHKMAQALKLTKSALASTTAELTKTKTALADAGQLLSNIQTAVTSSNKSGFLTNLKETFNKIPFKEISQRLHVNYTPGTGTHISWN